MDTTNEPSVSTVAIVVGAVSVTVALIVVIIVVFLLLHRYNYIIDEKNSKLAKK